jgi:CheY-like chemotaxis protein
MNTKQLVLLLADDDEDDCLFFKQALQSLSITSLLITVRDGEQLMHLLTTSTAALPSVLFLDLNMPRKSGFECLAEIKRNPHLNRIPVIVLSTFFDELVTNRLFQIGALECLQKPTDFNQLKELIRQVLSRLAQRADLPTPPVCTVPDSSETPSRL